MGQMGSAAPDSAYRAQENVRGAHRCVEVLEEGALRGESGLGVRQARLPALRGESPARARRPRRLAPVAVIVLDVFLAGVFG